MIIRGNKKDNNVNLCKVKLSYIKKREYKENFKKKKELDKKKNKKSNSVSFIF